jgi:hypothetical protein
MERITREKTNGDIEKKENKMKWQEMEKIKNEKLNRKEIR